MSTTCHVFEKLYVERIETTICHVKTVMRSCSDLEIVSLVLDALELSKDTNITQ